MQKKVYLCAKMRFTWIQKTKQLPTYALKMSVYVARRSITNSALQAMSVFLRLSNRKTASTC